jgi:hypothetical protein
MSIDWSRMFQPTMVLMLLASVVVGAVVTKSGHEIGHALAALACGSKIREIRVMPGIQLYPSLKKASCRTVVINYTEPPARWQRGLVAFMGTGSTTVLAYLLLALLWWLRPSRYWQAFLAVTAILLAWDMYLYSTLPLLGLRRFIFFGGHHAEPVHAMELMGVPKVLFLTGLILSFVAFHSLLAWILLAEHR